MADPEAGNSRRYEVIHLNFHLMALRLEGEKESDFVSDVQATVSREISRHYRILNSTAMTHGEYKI